MRTVTTRSIHYCAFCVGGRESSDDPSSRLHYLACVVSERTLFSRSSLTLTLPFHSHNTL